MSVSNFVAGSFQRHAPVRIDIGGTLVGRRHGGDPRDPAEAGLSGPGVLLVRATRWTAQHARPAVQSGIHHVRRGGQGRRTEDRTPADGESESGSHQRYKKERRSEST